MPTLNIVDILAQQNGEQVNSHDIIVHPDIVKSVPKKETDKSSQRECSDERKKQAYQKTQTVALSAQTAQRENKQESQKTINPKEASVDVEQQPATNRCPPNLSCDSCVHILQGFRSYGAWES